MKKSRTKKRRNHLLCFAIIFVNLAGAQNLVRNPNFTELDSCPNSFGQIYFASPWVTGNSQSPDLFHSCSESEFYLLPIDFSCAMIEPPIDDGVIGIVTYGRLPNGNNIREIMTTRFNKGLVVGQDTYVSISVFPRPRCPVPPDANPGFLCYSNGIAMAMVYENGQKQLLVRAEEIVDNIEKWTILKGCYDPTGAESMVEIQNFFDNSQTDFDCDTISERDNISYTFVDNIVVAPFNILPDTLVVCDLQELQFPDIDFYSLPLSWDDGISTGSRNFEHSGIYTLLADAEECILEESLVVIVADEQEIELERSLTKCEGEPLIIKIKMPGEVTWNNGETTSSIRVLNSGTYIAEVVTICNVLEFVYVIQEIDCDEVIYTGNVFSPNGDGINDDIQFYLNPMLSIDGTIRIFDRWGTQVFESSILESQGWEGRTNIGTPLSEGVYIWTFVSQDRSITQTGDITLIR